ncbi:serine/threonine-protein kinase [Polyangium aurulentum]|uniref:serine/threonine-protein kinase n=1 Tax=Polyangium aurulentum TaxID=2567896 RepID=UPI0010ADEA47|nr:serine/threonine-protein kinase [Polyangium aurulentum]UQA55530.1 serine/threonine protein kinase [Polyangium aurulentum]
MSAASPESNPAEERLGRVLRDKWRLDRVLGAGGFGAVYAATHRNGKRVAIKILHRGLSVYPEVRDRFLREAYAVNAVDHPGVVSVLDDDVDEDGSIFLVMELLEGETLEDRRIRSGGKLDVFEVLSVADQVLDVLAAAHDKGVIHRDLKPENVFLQRTGQVKLLDFGIAKQRRSRGNFVTMEGMMLGTPAFMPPEQARGKLDMVDERSDLWALAATLWSLLTGEPVHGDLTPQESLAACISRPAPSLATAVPGAPRPLVDLIDRALAFEREGRFQSAREMQQAVRLAYQIMRGSHSAPPPPAPPPAPPSGDEEPPTEIFDRAPLPDARPRLASFSDDDPTEVVDRHRATLVRGTSPNRPGPQLASIFDSADFSASVSVSAPARTPVVEAKKPARRSVSAATPTTTKPLSRPARVLITVLVALMLIASLAFAVVAVMHLLGKV